MRWIMNALMMSCSLSLGLSSLPAQTPDAAGGGQAAGANPQSQGSNQPQQQADAAQNADEAFRRGTPGLRGTPPSGAAGGAGRPANGAEGAEEAFRRGTPGFRGAPPTGAAGGTGRPGNGAEGATGGAGGFAPVPGNVMSRLPLMMALDVDGDGQISSVEIDGAVTALKKLDRNADGSLTMDELMPEGMPRETGPGKEVISRMMMADLNNDGFIDQDEMPGRMKTMLLDRGDTDKDGQLSREEITRVITLMNRPGRPAIRGDDRGALQDAPSNGADEPERPRRTRND